MGPKPLSIPSSSVKANWSEICIVRFPSIPVMSSLSLDCLRILIGRVVFTPLDGVSSVLGPIVIKSPVDPITMSNNFVVFSFL